MTLRRTQLVARCLLYRHGKYLLMKRPKEKGGGFGLVGGHVEPDESPIEALCRETFEEIGIHLDPEHLHLIKVIYRGKGSTNKVHFIYQASKWEGSPVNREPKKCKGLEWCARNELPTDLSPTTYLSLHPEADDRLYLESHDH